MGGSAFAVPFMAMAPLQTILFNGTQLLLLFSCMCGFAKAAEPSFIAEAESGEKRLLCKRIAEGIHHYELATSTSSELLWKSFWGRGTGVFSPNGKFLAVTDTGRFNVLGPILVFTLSGKETRLVYQSPANFSNEEDRFGYRIISLSDDALKIGVFKNVFTDASSRATEGKGFTYAIDLKSLKPITPGFYAKDHSLYYNVNADEQ